MTILSRRAFLATAPAVLAPASLALAAPSHKNPVGTRDAMLRSLGAPDCWAAANKVGAEAIEVTVDDKWDLPFFSHPQPYNLGSPEGIKRLSDDMKAAGVRISAFCVASHFDTRPDFEVDFCSKLAKISQQLGIRAMRIDVVARKMQAAEFVPIAVPVLKKLIAASEGTGVRFGAENHGPTGNNPDFLFPMLEGVNSKRMGVTLDTGNFYWFGHPISKVYELIERVAPHVVHTHCKNIGYPEDKRNVQRPMGWEYAKFEAPVDKGDLDFSRIVKILTKAKYEGDFCVENETLGRMPEADRSTTIAAEIAHLKKLRA
jgi:sugar phosphate isomerase/epimerase